MDAARAVFCAVFCVSASLSAAACGSSSDGPSGPQIDGGSDADTPDVLPAEDAAPDLDAGPDAALDAKPDVVTPPSGFCLKLAPAPKFCDDFDDGNLTDDWTAFAAEPGATFALDTATATSAPASFHLVALATAAAAPNNVLLRSTMFGAVQQGKLAFSANLANVTFTKGTIAIAKFHVTLDDAYTLYLRGPDSAGNVATLEEDVGGVVTQHPLGALPTAGAWTRVTLDLDLVNGKASVSFDAQKALDAVAITPVTGTEATIRLGAIVDGPADQVEAHFDDVVIDF